MGRWEWKGLVTREDTRAQSDQAQGESANFSLGQRGQQTQLERSTLGGLRELSFPRVRQGLNRCIHCVVHLPFLFSM